LIINLSFPEKQYQILTLLFYNLIRFSSISYLSTVTFLFCNIIFKIILLILFLEFLPLDVDFTVRFLGSCCVLRVEGVVTNDDVIVEINCETSLVDVANTDKNASFGCDYEKSVDTLNVSFSSLNISSVHSQANDRRDCYGRGIEVYSGVGSRALRFAHVTAATKLIIHCPSINSLNSTLSPFELVGGHDRLIATLEKFITAMKTEFLDDLGGLQLT